jgi:DNA-binding NarL/FixJ family response regulator
MTVHEEKLPGATPAASNGVMSHRRITGFRAELSALARDGNGTPRRVGIAAQLAQLDNRVDGTLKDVDLQLLRLLAQGLALDAVARHMDCSERTVSRHIRRLSDRIGVSTPIQAVVWAVRRGLI